ncbi:MAG: toprim domain-containing protein, partial [Candidatus Syntrophoarchaeum sp.]|nr:toprim domain-containing protein [Candidatus Syntrophoarchaeum sp.]
MIDEPVNLSLTARLRERLLKGEYATDKTAVNNNLTISNLKCPVCNDKTAWAYYNNPFTINCNRKNKCGKNTKTLELFPDINVNIERQYPRTKNDPDRPARAYLMGRGLTASLNGLEYKHEAHPRGLKCGAVMFKIAPNVWNGRIYNPPEGAGKTHNKGSTAGLAWFHTACTYKNDKPLYVTESVIDALSLIEIGYQAAAVLSAGQTPKIERLKKYRNIVIAFDNDRAGHYGAKKWAEELKKAKIIFPVKKDWNYLLQTKGKEGFKKHFKESMPEMEHLGKLVMAKTAQEYAEIVYSYRGSLSGLFEFDGCLHWAFTSKKNAPLIKTIARFTLKVKYFNRSEKDPKDIIDSYCVEITPKSKRKSFTAIMTHNDLATPNGMQLFALKKRVVWAGNRAATLALAKQITEADAPTVREIDIYGYDKKSNAYVFPAFGINKNGEYIKAEGSGFIYTDKAKKEAVRACHSPSLIEPQTRLPAGGQAGVLDVRDVYKLIAEAWPKNGEIAFTWTVASWFVNQIKDKIKQFPILSLFGEPSSGKSFLTKTLKALQCENSEGLPMRKSNTVKGELRKLTQRSGLFEALIEWPENGQTRFELENILTLYNVAPLHIMALKSNDNRTVELPFFGALMFVQNRDIFQNEQQKERVIALKF